MKWTGFLIGGLAGMAAGIVVARKSSHMLAWTSSATGNAWKDARGKMFEAAINKKFGKDNDKEKQYAESSTNQSGQSGDSKKQIEMLINSDPSVKKESDQILSESKSH